LIQALPGIKGSKHQTEATHCSHLHQCMENMNSIVILCESYASILYVLYRHANDNRDVPVTIFIPTLKDLHQLLQFLNEKVFENKYDILYYSPYKTKRADKKGLKKFLYLLVDILGERRHLARFYKEHFTTLKDAEILFPSPGYSGAKIYFLRKLRAKNKLTFIDPGLPYMGSYFPHNLRDIATLLLYKVLYGKDVQIGQYPPENPWSKGFPLLPDSFMKKVDGVIDWSKRDEIMASFPWEKYSILDTGDYKVIYFHQDLVGRYGIDHDTFSRELNSIFDILLRYYPEKEIARKYHPGHEFNKDVIQVGDELPTFIPAEFLYNEKLHLYLGISSDAIVSVRGGKTISLLYLISFKPPELRERFKERLVNKSTTEILFPKTLEEFEQTLIKLKQQNT
jgi:hypothetical protein